MTNGPVRSWILHRSFILSAEHEICSDLKFCEVEEIPLFSMKLPSVSILCGHEAGSSLGIYDLADHSSLVEGAERGDGALCTQRGQRHYTG